MSLPHASIELPVAQLWRSPEGERRARFCAAANRVVVMHLQIEAVGDALGAMELAAVRNVLGLCVEEVENGGGGGRKAIMMPRHRLTRRDTDLSQSRSRRAAASIDSLYLPDSPTQPSASAALADSQVPTTRLPSWPLSSRRLPTRLRRRQLPSTTSLD
ncbi:hypothetical protein Cni_G15356 [Canna indica]|uniref:Uncharacterized protein n=1 Tax=Canna indica TaxID=4628 RepID=A0AAQ3KDZ0_9LILI|nr:hypothetical protein Cni_G15356 [Canna indica]